MFHSEAEGAICGEQKDEEIEPHWWCAFRELDRGDSTHSSLVVLDLLQAQAWPNPALLLDRRISKLLSRFIPLFGRVFIFVCLLSLTVYF